MSEVGSEKEEAKKVTKTLEAATKENLPKELRAERKDDEGASDSAVNGENLNPSIHVNEGGYIINHACI